jgi:hypothetical protein
MAVILSPLLSIFSFINGIFELSFNHIIDEINLNILEVNIWIKEVIFWSLEVIFKFRSAILTIKSG